jgi:phage-related protein
MTTDAIIADLDGDGSKELVIVGEWMPVKIFKKEGGKFVDRSVQFGFEKTSGLWNTVHVDDFNGDGIPDILVGNKGNNTRLKASPEEPLRLYINDFDQNGSIEQILTIYENGESFPLILKQTLLKQLPGLRKDLLTYDLYKDKRMEDLFHAGILDNSKILEVQELETTLYLNSGEW